MVWIRNAWWDCGWILSGLPLGAICLFVSHWVPVIWLMTGLALVFQIGHSLSPVVLAWSHCGFRAHMLRHPVKFVAVPLVSIVSITLIGYVCGKFWPVPTVDALSLAIMFRPDNPLYWIVLFHIYWNIWHFGMQHFGMMSIYRRLAGWYRGDQRRKDLVYCRVTCCLTLGLSSIHAAANYLRWPLLGVYEVFSLYATVAIIGAAYMFWREWRCGGFCFPRLALIATSSVGAGTIMLWPVLGLGTILMSHWLGAIGLSGHASRRNLWVYCPILIGVGILIYLAIYADFRHLDRLAIPTTLAAIAVAFRTGISTNHFLYDRWVWKFSDPQVRATIGRDLFCSERGVVCG